MTFDWTTQDPPERFTWMGQGGPVSVRLAFGPAALPIALAGASAAMTVIGGIAKAGAQREAGENAYQDALARNRQLEQVAKAREAEGKAAQAAKQREGLESLRKGELMASRARAVMAAGGGGVDERIIAGLMAEGEYGKDVALFEGDETARKYNQQAEFDRYSGRRGVAQGENTRSAANRAADWTIIGSVGSGVTSLAKAYGGEFFNGPTGAAAVDKARTAGDADLGGYNSSGKSWLERNIV